MRIYTNAKALIKHSFSIKETKCAIITDKPEAVRAAEASIIYHRQQLESYVKANPIFLSSLESLEVYDGPYIAKLMASASAKAEVGPMASVAGALADLAVKAMLNYGARTAVIENGGEVSAVSEIPVDVALLAGNSPLSGRFGFRIEKFPKGVATSSGVYGHALSFGKAEAVTVFSENASLADAAATAVCNVVKDEQPERAIMEGIKKAWSIEGVEGVIIIYKDKVAYSGEVPQFIRIEGGGDPRI
ncbi:MAG: UPF0280 family protein [Candidatus Bathycorpusculaceae bacterium]